MKFIVLLLLIFFYLHVSYGGDIEGYVFRKANNSQTIKINRYSLRNTLPAEQTSSISGDLAIVYLTTDKKLPGSTPKTPKIKQLNLAFDPWLLPVYVGTRVEFPNMDLVFHNVFSYSKAKKFDLGRYGKGKSKQVLFDKPGLVKVFCEIHKTMRAYILVLETPLFTTTNNSGYFIINDVPEGRYSLHVWQENTEEYITSIEINNSDLLKLEIR